LDFEIFLDFGFCNLDFSRREGNAVTALAGRDPEYGGFTTKITSLKASLTVNCQLACPELAEGSTGLTPSGR